MSTVKVNNINSFVYGTRDTLSGLAQAWANMDQTGTTVLEDSENISSVADLNNGEFRFTFSSNMANAGYASIAMGDDMNWGGYMFIVSPERSGTKSTSQVRIDGAAGNGRSNNRSDQADASYLWAGDLA